MENDRREDQQSSNPPSEAPHREEVSRDWEGSSAASREPDDGGFREPYPHTPDQHREGPPEAGSHPEGQEPPYESSHPTEGGSDQGSLGPRDPMGGVGRGRRRGGRGRPSPRDRRMQARRGGRDRDRGGHFNRPPGAPPMSGGPSGTHPGDRDREEHRYSDLPPEQRSLILQAKAEVERIREALENVLRDLENVSEQLTRAEHEKDVAEAEIEQLRDQLRRLHR